MRYFILVTIIVAITICSGEWIFGPEDFEEGSDLSEWYIPPSSTTPMIVYGPGYESDYAVGTGVMTWPFDYWEMLRTPIVDCSTADSVFMVFRMYNTAVSGDWARFYIWVEPDGYLGDPIVYDLDVVRDWELINIDFTEHAAGRSQVYFYFEVSFVYNSSTHEAKFDNVGVSTRTALSVEEDNPIMLPDTGIRVYPNPASSFIAYSCDRTQGAIKLFDISGKVVAEGLPGEGKLDLANIATGVYILKSSSGCAKRIVVW